VFTPGDEFMGKRIMRAMPSMHGSDPCIQLDFGEGEGVLVSLTGAVIADISTPDQGNAPQVQQLAPAQQQPMAAPDQLPNWAGGAQGLPQQQPQQPQQPQYVPQAQPAQASAPMAGGFGGGMLTGFTTPQNQAMSPPPQQLQQQQQMPMQQQQMPQQMQVVQQQPQQPTYFPPQQAQVPQQVQFAPAQPVVQPSGQQVMQPVSAVLNTIPGLPPELAASKKAMDVVKWLVDNKRASTQTELVELIFPYHAQLVAFSTSTTKENVQRRVDTALQLLNIALNP
jgi:hypothetical protein